MKAKTLCNFIEENCMKYTVDELVPILNSKFGTNYTSKSLRKHYYRHNLEYKKEYKKKCGWKSPLAKPIGSESNPDKNGLIRIKVNDKRWEYKQRYIYEQYHKVDLPEETLVTFLDGDKTNFDIDNLIAVPRHEIEIAYGCGITSSNKELSRLGFSVAHLMNVTKEMEMKAYETNNNNI